MIKWNSQTVYSEIRYVSFDILQEHEELWKIIILKSYYIIFDSLLEENRFVYKYFTDTES